MEDFIAWDHVVIIVLGCLLAIFFFIIISLLWRIYTLKIQIYSTSSQMPSIISECLKESIDVLLPSAHNKLEKSNLQMFSSSSDISSPPQCFSDKNIDSSFCSDSSDSGHTSLYRKSPMDAPTHPTYQPTPIFQAYLYKNLTTLQEDAASECCSLLGKETKICQDPSYRY